VGDKDDTQDWAADCNGEGQERAVREGGDCGVVMMDVALEDGGGGQQWQRRTRIAAEDNGMQDQAADYDGEVQERAARVGRDSGVAMMAAVAEDGGGGQRLGRWTTTAMADDDSGGQQRWRMMTHARLSDRLLGGRRRAGGKQQRH
jgi:hypothetical protein